MYKILLVEDDPGIADPLTDILRGEGFAVTVRSGQTEALRALEQGAVPDIALLDLSLAEGNGFSLCNEIKSRYRLPVIFLTASGDEDSVCRGLEIGADDYIAKPFRARELIQRIKNVLRRSEGSRNVIELGDISVDIDKGSVCKNGAEIALSALEYRILLVFLSNRGRLLSRARLLDEIWDASGDFVNDNTLTVYVKRIREKVEDDPAAPICVQIREKPCKEWEDMV